jgi:glycosyltransferase involved in cell wall biosynthesis
MCEKDKIEQNSDVQILYVLSHPIQYFTPLLKQMANKFDLRVAYLSKVGIGEGIDFGFGHRVVWDEPLLEGYSSFFVKNYSKSNYLDNRFFNLINPGIIKVLLQSKENIVIINGWSYSTNWLIFLICKVLNKKVWLRAESPLNQELKKSPKVLFLKRIVLRHILFRFFIDKFLYIGTQNKLFYKYYRVSESRLIYTPYATDNQKFRLKHKELTHQKDAIKENLSIPTNHKVILYSGKYIAKKRPMDLVKAFELMENSQNITLVLMGEGGLRGEMEEYIRFKKIQNVFLTGFINQSKISEYYSIADVFIMCSGVGETWGLSVNEAMNFKLPIVVSETCGCSTDLVQNGINGFTYKEGDVCALSEAIECIINNDDLREKMGNKSIDIVSNYSIDHSVSNLLKAISFNS